MDKNQEIEKIRIENTKLKEELATQKSNYKRLSSELGHSIFENEDLELENKKLKNEIKKLNKENIELKEFKQEVESSTIWKIKSLFK